MPPSSGRIHSLPIKILYNLDTSSQSYVTLLDDRQDVYVHPKLLKSSDDSQEGPVGSCYLKVAAKGICYASPECIPNQSKLDFSVYNLDPTFSSRPAPAFANSAPSEGSWTGKGFLSWAMTESGSGTTLIKGRLVQDHDFTNFSSINDQQGGLEGLMAAAERAGMARRTDRPNANGSNGGGDGDLAGWGLEVHLSLKMLNPEGKEEFRGRKEFEDLLKRGTGLANANGSSGAGSSPPSVASNSTIRRDSVPRRNGSQIGPGSGGGSTVIAPSPLRANGSVPMPLPHNHSSAGVSRPSSGIGQGSSSAGGLRPSPVMSKPQLPNSTSNRSSSRTPQLSSLPPSSIPMAASSSAGASRPSSSHDQRSSAAPSVNGHQNLQPPTNANSRDRSREITPPPLPQPKSPPPSTPSRRTLHDILRSDSTMSPKLASQLASNPMLLKLLKAVPPNLRHQATIKAENAGALLGTSEDKDSPNAETPTPSTSLGTKTEGGQVSNDACCNCGATESSLWMSKKMKDGKIKKVCNECGVYFNAHKRMRPRELWNTPQSDIVAAHEPKRQKFDVEQPVRSSPRRHKTSHSIDMGNSNNNNNNNHRSSIDQGNNGIFSSPKKRAKVGGGKTPQASPRMATRASSKNQSNDNSLGISKALDFSDTLFSPSTMFGTSPAQIFPAPNGLDTDASGVNGLDGTLSSGLGATNGASGEDQIDIEALLSQLDTEGNGNGFSLDAIFGNGGSENILDLLNTWENEAKTTSDLTGQSGS